MGLNFKGKQMCWSSSELRWSYTAGRKGTHGKYSPCSLARAASSLAVVKRREWVSWQITSSCHKWLAEGRHSVRFPRSQPVKKTLPPLFRMDFIWLLITEALQQMKEEPCGWLRKLLSKSQTCEAPSCPGWGTTEKQAAGLLWRSPLVVIDGIMKASLTPPWLHTFPQLFSTRLL